MNNFIIVNDISSIVYNIFILQRVCVFCYSTNVNIIETFWQCINIINIMDFSSFDEVIYYPKASSRQLLHLVHFDYLVRCGLDDVQV